MSTQLFNRTDTIYKLLLEIGDRRRVILPRDEAYYQNNSVWNHVYQGFKPSMIVRPCTAEDVLATLRYAQRSGMPMTARSSGRSGAKVPHTTHGVLLDFSPMRKIDVDSHSGRATIQIGALFSDLKHTKNSRSLPAPMCVITHTGVYSLGLGGGLGWLCRRYGASVDDELRADVILPDGNKTAIFSSDRPDLFWAIRKDALYLGIITSITIKSRRAEQCYYGTAYYPISRANALVKAVNEFQQSVSCEFNCELSGGCKIDECSETCLKVCYKIYADDSEVETIVEPLKCMEGSIRMSWRWTSDRELRQILNENAYDQRCHYAHSALLSCADVNEDYVEAFVRGILNATNEHSKVEMIGLGGRIKGYGQDDTAFRLMRQHDWLVHVLASWDPCDDNSEDSETETIASVSAETISGYSTSSESSSAPSIFDTPVRKRLPKTPVTGSAVHHTWCEETFDRLQAVHPKVVDTMSDHQSKTAQLQVKCEVEAKPRHHRRVRNYEHEPDNFVGHGHAIVSNAPGWLIDR